MIEYLKRTFEARRAAQEQLKALYDAANAETRSLNADEAQTEGRLVEEIRNLQEREANLIAQIEADAKADEARAASEAAEAANAERHQGSDQGETRSDADVLRAMARGEVRSHSFEARDDVALQAGSATDGAEVVPTTLHNSLVDFLRERVTVMSANANIVRTSGGEDLVIPRVTSHSVASIVAEGGTIGRDAPQFDTITLGAYKYALLIQVTRELAEDRQFDITGFLIEQAGEALDRGMGAHLLSGTGTGQPNGIATAVTTGVTAASATAITGDELIDLQHSIVTGYRGRASWVMKDSTFAAIRKLKDGDGQYLWRPGLEAGASDTLLGRPVLTDDGMAAIATGVDSVIFGDLSGYWVRMVGAVDIALSTDFAFDTDMVTYRFVVRADGDLVNTRKVRALTQA